MIKKISKKVITLLIALIISVILSAVISNCLNLIFMKVPEQILELNPSKIINNLVQYEATREMFFIIILAFMILAMISTFKLFKLNNYYAKTYQVTPEIEIPLPVRKESNSTWLGLVVR